MSRKSKYGRYHENFRLAADHILAANKVISVDVAEEDWKPGQYSYEQSRLRLPLTVNGEAHGVSLEIHSYPYKELKYTIGLVALDKMVCRLDFHPDATHTVPAHQGCGSQVVIGPHWHKWELNRLLLNKSFGDVELLPFVDPLPQTPKTFDGWIRIYCRQRNIDLQGQAINLPLQRGLL